MSYYIGIDIGTSSVKAMLINENEIQNTISKDYPIYLSNGNYAEQNPEDWYRQSMLAMKELLRDVDKSEVKAIGFCGQMHGLVLLDEKDEVIRPAILWNDGRSEKEVDYLNNKIGKDFLLDNTGNIAFAGLPLRSSFGFIITSLTISNAFQKYCFRRIMLLLCFQACLQPMFPTPQAHCILILSIAAGQSQCFNYCILTKVFCLLFMKAVNQLAV